MIPYKGSPADWVVKGGKPAACLGSGGLPSYESDDGFRVYDFAVVALDRNSLGARLIPRSYGTVAMLFPDQGLIKACPFGEEKYRPKLHWWTLERWWQARGSQEELEWRKGIGEVMKGNRDPFGDANEKAEDLLLEELTPQQRIEYVATGHFRVRGASTHNLYRITVGDGFDLLDSTGDQTLVSFCLHPEYWIPDADIALATMFALQDPEGERECLEAAKPYYPPRRRKRNWKDDKANELEHNWELV